MFLCDGLLGLSDGNVQCHSQLPIEYRKHLLCYNGEIVVTLLMDFQQPRIPFLRV